jgi:hypothetical protein
MPLVSRAAWRRVIIEATLLAPLVVFSGSPSLAPVENFLSQVPHLRLPLGCLPCLPRFRPMELQFLRGT